MTLEQWLMSWSEEQERVAVFIFMAVVVVWILVTVVWMRATESLPEGEE